MNTWSDSGYTETNGNYGLLDQQLAVQFIIDNAENIGGDPDRITLMGESAGSMAVAYQLLSDTCGMLSGAVLQSGVAAFDQTNQESYYANEFISDFTKQFVEPSKSCYSQILFKDIDCL